MILINMEFDAVLGGWKTANDGVQMSFKINCSSRNIFALQKLFVSLLALGAREDFVFVDHDPWPLIFEGRP